MSEPGAAAAIDRARSNGLLASLLLAGDDPDPSRDAEAARLLTEASEALGEAVVDVRLPADRASSLLDCWSLVDSLLTAAGNPAEGESPALARRLLRQAATAVTEGASPADRRPATR